MSKILITGATGGLGASVIDFLADQLGIANIVALTRNPKSEKVQRFAQKGIEIRQGDYLDKVSLVSAFQGIDALYFVSGNEVEGRLQQHQNVVEASIEAKVGHIVYTSFVRKNESESAPVYPVLESHLATEKWIKESGITYTILQHNVYAEIIPMFLGDKNQLLNTKTVFLPTKDGKVSFVPRVELAEAAANILRNPAQHSNKIYAFNGSEAIGFAEIAQYLSKTLGEEIAYYSPEVPEFESALKSAGVPDATIGFTIMFSAGFAANEYDGSGQGLEQILGRKTKSIAEFVQEVYQ